VKGKNKKNKKLGVKNEKHPAIIFFNTMKCMYSQKYIRYPKITG